MSDEREKAPVGQQIEIEIGGLHWQWDLSKGSLRHCGMPAVALWVDHSIGRMLHPLRHEIGPALSDLLIASSGREGALTDYRAIVSQHGPSFEEGFAGWSRAVASSGFGVFSLLEYDRQAQQARVRVDHPWELELAVGLPATCPFIQGKLIGLFSLPFETGCWANPVAGDDSPDGFVEFGIEPSQLTIADEIESLRHARRQQAEIELIHEVNRQTLALKAVEESQRSILNSLGDLLVTLNAQGLVEQYIPPKIGGEGFPAPHLALGRPISEVFGEPFSKINNHLTQSAKPQLLVSSEINVAGEIRHFEARVSIRKRAGDSVEGLTLLIRDVSVQRQLEQELRDRQNLQNLEQLASGIAHDFNNVLHTVLSAAQMIKQSDHAKVLPLADTIIQATGSAAGLIERMQHLTSRQRRQTHLVNLHQTIDRTAKLFCQQSDEAIVLSVALNAQACCLQGDDSQLEHMLLNLCLNAKQAMPDGGRLDITTTDFKATTNDQLPTLPLTGALHVDRPYVAITIEDTGAGMDADTVNQIFQPFFTTRKNDGGTGLGLLGVEAALVAHAGAISVQSVPAQGSRFIVYLPVDLAPVSPAPIQSSS